MSFLEQWNSVRFACFARLSMTGLSPVSLLPKMESIPTSERATQRFEHYELMSGRRRKTGRVGSGCDGVTYKAFDVDLRCPVTLKVISERISRRRVG